MIYAVASQGHKPQPMNLQLLIDSIPALIHSGLPDGYLDFFNRRWLSYVGLSLEDLSGWKWTATIHPEDVAAMVQKWRAALTTGEPFEHETRVRRADGEYRWFLVRTVPLRDEMRNVVKWFGTSTEIEDRKRAEAALRRSEAYLAAAQRLSHTGSWALNMSSGELFWSQETYRIFGFDPTRTGASINETFLQRIHPEDRSKIEEGLKAAAIQTGSYGVDYRIVLPDNSIKHIHDVVYPVTSEAGDVVERYGVIMDVTDRKRAEEELRRRSGRLLRLQDQERRRIARELHDSTGQNIVALATMLGQLRGAIPSVERKSRKLLAQCKALADQCIREVRTLSYVLHPPALDTGGLGDAIRDYVDGFIKRSGIQVELELSPHVGRMARDVEVAVFRVVQEALTNVQRHSGSQQAKIRIDRNPNLTLEISDHGRGAPASVRREKEEHPFEVGVGIPSMQERIKLIGGRFEIDSTSHGTTVRVTIPSKGNEREKTSHSDS